MSEPIIEIDGYTMNELGGMYPEQHDVLFNGEQVGYLRLRHGKFTVECPDVNGALVLTAYPDGDGFFTDDERMGYLKQAVQEIDRWRKNSVL